MSKPLQKDWMERLLTHDLADYTELFVIVDKIELECGLLVVERHLKRMTGLRSCLGITFEVYP